MVTTERLWSGSRDQSSRWTPSTRIAAMIARTLPSSIPSEKFGTHSTTAASADFVPVFLHLLSYFHQL